MLTLTSRTVRPSPSTIQSWFLQGRRPIQRKVSSELSPLPTTTQVVAPGSGFGHGRLSPCTGISKPDLKSRLNRSGVTRPSPARPFDDVFSFHFGFSGSPAALEDLRWHDAVRGLKLIPVLVEPCCGLVARHAESRDLLSEPRSFDDKFDAMGAPSADRRRPAQTFRKSAELAPESVEEQKKKPLKCKKGASAQSLQRAHEQRSDCSSGVLGHACRSDELQWNGSCRACRSADLSPHSLRIWRDRLEQFGNEIGEACFIRVHWSIKQRC